MAETKAGSPPHARNDQVCVVGGPDNFWLWSANSGWDLTHPKLCTSVPIQPRLHLECEISNVTIDPAKTALVIIDMQNYSLSKDLLGQIPPAIHAARDVLLECTIPAARHGNIQIIWLNWGITEEELPAIPPSSMRVFGWRANCKDNDYGLSSRHHEAGEAMIQCGELPRPKAPGTDLGRVELEDGGEVDAGRALMRGTWNAELHDSCRTIFEQGQAASRPDIVIDKNRNSGLYDSSCDCTQYLQNSGIKTLLFAGINTDQCVMANLQDAHSRGYDTIMLRDACGTDSPGYTIQSAEYNLCRNWGFLSDSKALAAAVKLNKSK